MKGSRLMKQLQVLFTLLIVLSMIPSGINTRTVQAESYDGWEATPTSTTVSVEVCGSTGTTTARVGYRNSGSQAWNTSEVSLNRRYVTTDSFGSDGNSKFYCSDWEAGRYRAAYVNSYTANGGTGYFNFSVCNHGQPNGTYYETFDIAHGGDWFYWDTPSKRVKLRVTVKDCSSGGSSGGTSDGGSEPPDLDISFERIVTDSPYYPGDTIEVRTKVKNYGDESAGASSVRFYISDQKDGEPLDPSGVKTMPVPALEPGERTDDHIYTTLTIPADLTPDTYYVVFEADSENQVAESDEDNKDYDTLVVSEKALPTVDWDANKPSRIEVCIEGNGSANVTSSYDNTGIQMWQPNGSNAVSLNRRWINGDDVTIADGSMGTYDISDTDSAYQNFGDSLFACNDWEVGSHRASYIGSDTATSETGSFEFQVCNDNNLPNGTYQETFDIAHGDTFFYVDNGEKTSVQLDVTVADDCGGGGGGTSYTPPDMSIDDVQLKVGEAGTTIDAVFTVRLSEASTREITVNYTTIEGTATDPENFTAQSGTLTFEPGTTEQTIRVSVQGGIFDGNKTFSVELSDATNVDIADDTGVATITGATACGDCNMDGSIDADDITALDDVMAAQKYFPFCDMNGDQRLNDEDKTGIKDLVAGRNVNTWTCPVDPYTPWYANGKIWLEPNPLVKGRKATITVEVRNDTDTARVVDVEFYISDLGVGQWFYHVGTVKDVVLPPNSISYPSWSWLPVNPGHYCLKARIVGPDNSHTIQQNYDVVDLGDGCAVKPFEVCNDFAIEQTFQVMPIGVNNPEGCTANVEPSSVTLEPGECATATASICVPDLPCGTCSYRLETNPPTQGLLVDVPIKQVCPVKMSIEDATIQEGDDGTKTVQIPVKLSARSAGGVSVKYQTFDGGKFPTFEGASVAKGDYLTSEGILNFRAGSQEAFIDLPINGDTLYELDEALFIQLSEATNAELVRDRGKVTIENDDEPPRMSIDDCNIEDNSKVTEGDAGEVRVTFNVNLLDVSGVAATALCGTVDGNQGDYKAAKAPSDYRAEKVNNLSFDEGTTGTKECTIVVNSDTLYERDESFFAELTDLAHARIEGDPGMCTIVNDDPPPMVSIEDLWLEEGDAGMTNFPFTVRLSAVSGLPATITYSTIDGTATPTDTDYITVDKGTLTIPPGENTGQVTGDAIIKVIGDRKYENNETFDVRLVDAIDAIIDTTADQATGTIENDDPLPELSIDDVRMVEGNDGAETIFTFTVKMDRPSAFPVTVDYATADSVAGDALLQAIMDTDYLTTSGTLDFPPNTTTQPVTVTVVGDNDYELDELFEVLLSNAEGATIADDTGIGTIENDDLLPELSIDDVRMNEGDTGTVDFVFTVTLSGITNVPVTVDYTTGDITTTATVDYTSENGSLRFAPGKTTETIIVSVKSDLLYELDEDFIVTLQDEDNATVVKREGIGTIVNDDLVPTITISDDSVNEPEDGNVEMSFIVTLSNPSGYPVTVDFTTADITATADVDYISRTGTLVFEPSTTTQVIAVTVNGDTEYEYNETFAVNLDNADGATIADGQGIGTINDEPPPKLSIGNVTMAEGNDGSTNYVFDVTIGLPSIYTVNVNYETIDSTAKVADGDYEAANDTLSFEPGEVTKQITVTVYGDLRFEDDELFLLKLVSANLPIADSTGIGTIENDDDPPALSIGDVTVTEKDAADDDVEAVFTVTLSQPSGKDVEVRYSTKDDEAVAGKDYVALDNVLLIIPAGATEETIVVPVKGDTTYELTETFTVELIDDDTLVNATIDDGIGEGSIVDNEEITISINNVTASEKDGKAVFTVEVDGADFNEVEDISINVGTEDGTAELGSDFKFNPGLATLTFAKSTTFDAQEVTVEILSDGEYAEPDETYLVTLKLDKPYHRVSISDENGKGIIIDNSEPPPEISITNKVIEVVESTKGPVKAEFTVKLSKPSEKVVTVYCSTIKDTAKPDKDYTGFSDKKIVFEPGFTEQTCTVDVLGETLDGDRQQFFVELSGAENATIPDAGKRGTVLIYQLGDCNMNGSVQGFSEDNTDVFEVWKKYGYPPFETAEDNPACDANEDDVLDVGDQTCIQNIAVGKDCTGTP